MAEPPHGLGRGRPPVESRGLIARARGWRVLDTLRSRMMALVVAALLPTTAYSLVMAQQAVAEQKARAEQSVRQVAALAANSQAEMLGNTRKLLVMISGLQETTGEVGPCNALLATILDTHPEFGNVYTVTREGTVRCSALALPDKVLRVNDPWLRQVLSTGGLTISPFVIGRVTGLPVLVASYPLPPGGETAAVAISIRSSWLNGTRLDAATPDKGRLVMLDRDGRAAPTKEEAERPLPQVDLPALVRLGRPTLFDARSEDGQARTYALEPLPDAVGHVLYSVPSATLTEAIHRDLLARLIGLAVLWVTVIAGAWIGARVLVTRWTGKLGLMANALSAGRFDDVQAPMQGAPRELRDLGETLTAMARRISVRDQELQHSIIAREALIREIHHRVKNNLQMITSLLSLQSRALKSEPARRVLSEIEIRIRALALVHRQLYEGEDMKSVNLQAFMGDLCQLVQDSAKASADRIRLTLDVPPLLVVAEKAVPLALLVTEALTNAVAHAFPDEQTGHVLVRIHAPAPGELLLAVTDDGVGMPPILADTQSLGTSLMRAFTKQLGGTLTFGGPPGTSVDVRFPALGFETT